jgi:hypothetical protein
MIIVEVWYAKLAKPMNMEPNNDFVFVLL